MKKMIEVNWIFIPEECVKCPFFTFQNDYWTTDSCNYERNEKSDITGYSKCGKPDWCKVKKITVEEEG